MFKELGNLVGFDVCLFVGLLLVIVRREAKRCRKGFNERRVFWETSWATFGNNSEGPYNLFLFVFYFWKIDKKSCYSLYLP